ncbi:MAG: MBL fold metallo-hydrolase [Pseudomonadota bacterium]
MSTDKPDVDYVFTTSPEPGETQDVTTGIRWLRMPLPFALSHINLWLLDDGEGCTIVDTGVNTKESREIWRRQLDGTRVSRVLVTHLHPDHAGCAGWLSETYDAELWMTREEYLLCRVLTADTGRAAPAAGVGFYRAAGFPDNALDRYRELFGMFGKFVAELPEAYTRLRDGQTVSIGGREWEVIVGRGHSPEHACLACHADGLLISGDQVLPTISSNVSVFPTEPLADPLDDWLTSLHMLKDRVAADTLVLPSHGRPFRGVRQRLDALIEEHKQALDALADRLKIPQRAIDVFPALFKTEIKRGNLIMATGESIAHLNYLIGQGIVERERDADQVDWYRTLT